MDIWCFAKFLTKFVESSFLIKIVVPITKQPTSLFAFITTTNTKIIRMMVEKSTGFVLDHSYSFYFVCCSNGLCHHYAQQVEKGIFVSCRWILFLHSSLLFFITCVKANAYLIGDPAIESAIESLVCVNVSCSKYQHNVVPFNVKCVVSSPLVVTVTTNGR